MIKDCKNKIYSIVFLFILSFCFLMFGFFSNTEKTVYASDDSFSAEIVCRNLSYSSETYLVYAVRYNGMVTEETEIRMLFWDDYKEGFLLGSEKHSARSIGLTTINGEDLHVFYSFGIAPKNLIDNVYCRIYAFDGEKEYYGDVMKYSALQYLLNMKKDENISESHERLCDSLLNYGAAAQIAFNYKTDTLSTDTYYKVCVSGGSLEDGCNSGLFKQGENVTVYASVAAEGYEFEKWTDTDGRMLGKEDFLFVTVDSDIKVVANYVQKQPDEYEGTEGLGFELNDDGESYLVTGIGTATDVDVIIPATYEGKPVTKIGDEAFSDCSSLTSVTIPDKVTSIGRRAFSDCSSLTSVTIPDGVTSIGKWAFSDCSSLTSINIPDGVTIIAYGTFSGCSGLTSINIPDGVTSIGEWAFRNCSSLTSINIPDGVTSIGGSAFSGCSSLTSINIPDGVTSIGECTFVGCIGLTSINIPDGVTSIGEYAFGGCSSLMSVFYYGDETKWNNIAIESGNLYLLNAERIYKTDALPESQYVVKHYFQKVDGNGYDLFETVDLLGVTGDTAQATINNYTGFYHDENNENALESGIIAGDNSLVLKVYYNRETYTVTLNGGDNAIETVGAGEYLYGTEVAVSVTSVGGFDFVCWAEGSETFSTSPQFTFTIERDITLDAKWKQTVFIGSVTQPQSITNYYSNRKLQPENLRHEFAFNDSPYYVGDDNAFAMMPILSFVDEHYDPVDQPSYWDVDSWYYNVTLEIKNELGNFVEVVDNDLYIESIDRNKCLIDFNEDAIGEIFRICIYPVGLASWQKDDISDFSTNFEITVIDGYNATTALDLAYINKIENNAVKDYNTGYIEFNGGAKWTAFANEKGIDLSTDHHAIILHNDITVTKDDVPEYFFYDVNVDENVKPNDIDSNRINGSLKDYVDVYFRKLSANENFIIEGNYFTLNCESFPLVVRERNLPTPLGETFESHSQIFSFVSDKKDDTAKIEIRNINLVGNASKTENTQKAGGLILLKATHVSLKAENNISNQWNINYFPDDNQNRIDINYCRAYDSFNSIMYVWGASDVHIDHCDFNGAGGPVFIVDHIRQNNQQLYTGLPSWIEVTNSTMHSFVTGTEAWFQMYNATAIPAVLKELSAAFNPFGKTYVVENINNPSIKYLDLIAVYKSGDEVGISEAMNVTGYFNMNGATCPMDFGTYNLPAIAESDSALAYKMQVLSGTIDAIKQVGTVAFVSSESTLNVIEYGSHYMAEGAAIFGGYEVGLVDGFNQQITDPTNSIFQGEQLYIYTPLGISFVAGYYNAGTTVDPTDISAFISTRL